MSQCVPLKTESIVLHNVLAAAPAMVLCLLLQGVVVAICLRRYARFRRNVKGQDLLWVDVLLLITVMLLTLLCNFAQMAIWAALFMFLGEFSDFATALYHSAVNFITLITLYSIATSLYWVWFRHVDRKVLAARAAA